MHTQTGPHRKISVLVVDDEEDLLYMVCRAIAFHGMEAKGITSDTELFSSLEEEHFDIILMDICVELADGRELTRQIKSDKRFSHIPVLLYSARHNVDDPKTDCGADGFLPKPFDVSSLISRLQELTASPAT